MKKIAVFTSGGDSPGMNAAIRAVVRAGIHSGLEVYGILRGYEGMIDGNFVPMDTRSVSNIIQLGGTILYTARSERFRTPEGRKLAFENLKAHDIDGIVAIGGDGTFTGADIFTKEYPLKIVGLPGTIDNDLYGTDFTIGYDTAINTAMWAIDNIKDTANAHDRLFFVEVMGRDSGFIALRSAIAVGAEAVLIPETHTDIDQLYDKVRTQSDLKKRACIVVVAEGDEFGGAYKISEEIRKRDPKLDIRVSVLGHMQRGGRPSCMDRFLASRLGLEAVKALNDGVSGVMIGQSHNNITYTPFEKSIKLNNTLNPVLTEMVEILS